MILWPFGVDVNLLRHCIELLVRILLGGEEVTWFRIGATADGFVSLPRNKEVGEGVAFLPVGIFCPDGCAGVDIARETVRNGADAMTAL